MIPRTTAVGTDVEAALPSALVAVTTTRMVEPTSGSVSPYVRSVAPATAVQLAPFSLQRCQAYAYVIGAVPFQLPVEAARISLMAGVPSITGGAVFDGATCAAASPREANPVTTAAATETPATNSTSERPSVTRIGFVLLAAGRSLDETCASGEPRGDE